MTAPKTHKVILATGEEARAVKLTARNKLKVLNWIPGAEYRELVAKSGQASNQRIMVPIKGTKRIKAAYFDDWIVKTKDGFVVVKFDSVGEKLFYPHAYPAGEEEKRNRDFERWAKTAVHV